jgi:hypothetical protein
VRLCVRERKVARAQFCESAVGAKARELEGRVGPRNDDEARRRREPLDEVVERRETLVFGDGVEIVHHNHELVPVRREPVCQLVDRLFDRHSRDPQTLQGTAAQALANPIHRLGQIPPQANRIVVSAVEREPGKRRLSFVAPATHGSRLPIARRRRDKRQRSAVAGVEHAKDAWPSERLGWTARRSQLRFSEGLHQITIDCTRRSLVARSGARRSRHNLSSYMKRPSAGHSPFGALATLFTLKPVTTERPTA